MAKNLKLSRKTKNYTNKSRIFSIFSQISKLVGLAAVIVAGVLALSALANAFTLPPVVSIGASPNPAAMSSTITAIGVDLSGSGISSVKIYENGNLVKQCPASSCAYLATHIIPGMRSYYAIATDRVGGSGTSSTLNVNFTNSPPVLAAIGNKSVEILTQLQFTISAYDYNGDPLTYSASGAPAGAIFDSSTRTFSWTPNGTQTGIHSVNFSVSDGFSTDSEVVAINVTDIKAPVYFNLGVNPGSPATYAPGQNYTFGSNWADDSGIVNVWIEFNGVNYSVSGVGGVYNFVANDLATGNYSYRWFANDSSGNSNSTSGFVYTIDKAPTITSVVVNPASPIIYGTASNFSCTNTGNLAPILYINGADSSAQAGLNITRSAGNYSLNCTALENQNYTGSYALANYTIDKAIPQLDSYLPISVTYGDAANYSANESNFGDSDLIYILTRNGVNIANGSSVSDNSVLEAGNYTYNYSTAGGENYTSAENIATLIVQKAIPALNISLSPNETVSWGTQTNVSGTNCPAQLTCNLYRNDVAVSNPDVANLSAGVYNYSYNTTGNENYTSASVSGVLTVTKVAPDLSFYLNGNASDLNITYNASVNASASSNTSTIVIYRNGADVTNELGSNVILGAGTYNYTAFALENENYSVANITRTLIVGKASAQCLISSNSPVTYPAPLNVSASCTNPEASLSLFRNGSDVTSENGNNATVGAGNWTYNVSVPESENYTSASNSTSVVVNKGSAQTSLSFDKSSPQNYSTPITATCSVISGEVTPVLYRNGSDVTNENGQSVILGAGNWGYNCTLAESANYTAVENASSFVIDPIAMPLHLYVDGVEGNKSVVYGTSTNVTGTKDFAEGSISLLRDGNSVGNPDITTLGAGVYNYTLNFAATQNYTSSSQSIFVNVSQATPLLNLSILPSNSVANGTATNVTGFGCPAELTCNLYRNGALVSNPDSANLGFGNYVYEYNTTGNANYSSASISGNLSVFDNTNPSIWFDVGTASSGNQTANSIAVNVSASDDVAISNITISLFDSTGFLASSTSTSNPHFVNFTGLSDGVYYFNATAYDSSNNSNSTETRSVVIDSSIPSVSGLNVSPNSIFLTQSVLISANVSDLSLSSVVAQITLPDSTTENITLSGSGSVYSNSYSNTLQNGTYGVRIIAIDNFGNTNSSENTTFAVNYAARTISNSYIYGAFYPSNFTYDVTTTSVTNSTVNDSTVNGNPVNISNSIIRNSTLSNLSLIDYCQVYDSVVIGGTCDHTYIDPSNVQNSTTTGSTVIDSNVWNSNVTYSYVENSSLDSVNASNSSIINSTLSNLTLSNAVVRNATLGDASNMTFSDGTIDGNTVYNGSFTYNGTTINLTSLGSRGFVYLVDYEPSASLAVSTLDAYAGDSIVFNASGSSDPNIVNGTNIALTFSDNLTYTFYFDGGDSVTTNESVVSHSYSAPGSYRVYVVVTDALGKFNTSVSYLVEVAPRPSSGGGGGGCKTDWVCSDWSACENGTKIRTCVKASARCYTSEAKPEEIVSCTAEPEKEKGIFEEISSKITEATSNIFGNSKTKLIAVFTLAVLAASGITWLLRRGLAKARK